MSDIYHHSNKGIRRCELTVQSEIYIYIFELNIFWSSHEDSHRYQLVRSKLLSSLPIMNYRLIDELHVNQENINYDVLWYHLFILPDVFLEEDITWKHGKYWFEVCFCYLSDS